MFSLQTMFGQGNQFYSLLEDAATAANDAARALHAMLREADVQCVAIADVQASRREAGKALVDGHYGNDDCALYRDFRNCWRGRTSTRS